METRTERIFLTERNSFGQDITREDTRTIFTGTVEDLAQMIPAHPYMVMQLTDDMKADEALIAKLQSAGCIPELKAWESIDEMRWVGYQLGRPEFCDHDRAALEWFVLEAL